jgi:hypothetical protein
MRRSGNPIASARCRRSIIAYGSLAAIRRSSARVFCDWPGRTAGCLRPWAEANCPRAGSTHWHIWPSVFPPASCQRWYAAIWRSHGMPQVSRACSGGMNSCSRWCACPSSTSDFLMIRSPRLPAVKVCGGPQHRRPSICTGSSRSCRSSITLFHDSPFHVRLPFRARRVRRRIQRRCGVAFRGEARQALGWGKGNSCLCRRVANM